MRPAAPTRSATGARTFGPAVPPAWRPPGDSARCGPADEFCGDLLGVESCDPFKRTTTAAVVGNCVLPCTSDAQCRKQFVYNQVSCKADAPSSPFLAGGKCCVAQGCFSDADCDGHYTCQYGARKR